MAQTYDLTKGKVSTVVLKFFFPLFFTNMLQQLYNIADTIIVGKGISDNALAAVGNMSSLTFLVIGFSMGLANGFSVSSAISFGAKDYSKLRKVFAASIKLSIAIAIILTALSMYFLRDVLELLQTDPLIIDDSLTYGYIIFGGLVTTIAYNLCAFTLRSLGDSRTPFFAIVVSSIINVVLNYVFICIVGMGVEGAAIATIISQVASTLICIRKLRRIEILKLTREDFKSASSMYLELFKNGLPMALMNSITAIGCMVVQYFVNDLSVAHTTAYAACSKYINLFMQPGCTAGFAMSSFTSQNYGAGQYKRIREGLHVCLKIAITSYVLLGSTMILIPETLARCMMNETASIELAKQFLPICGVMLVFVDCLFIFRSGCQAMGHPFVPMCSGVVEMVMRIVTIYFLVDSLDFKATALAECAAWLSAFLLNFIAFEIFINTIIRKNNSDSDDEKAYTKIKFRRRKV